MNYHEKDEKGTKQPKNWKLNVKEEDTKQDIGG